ncbi:MAG TPA: hypothetical protein DCP51_04865 [Clostridiales bacterium]|nr:hypothetical protein [Clostridiales bacterium]
MLSFKKIDETDLDLIKEYMKRQPFRSCDFSIFGIFLWADYYNYAYCIYEDTFFLKGLSDDKICDYAVPFGKMSTEKAIELIKEFCKQNGGIPRFYFVPEPAIEYFKGANIRKLEGWSDYIYIAEDLKTLKGHRFNKKRNRLNKFMRGCVSCRFEPITKENIEKAKEFFEVYLYEYAKDDERFAAESVLIRKALDMFFELDQIGGLLYIDDKAVAMTIGEIIGDTLIVHVEKALRQYDGAYEAINYAFANNNATEGVIYINREEDMGDEGLRQAKMAYNPVMMINKYEITFG